MPGGFIGLQSRQGLVPEGHLIIAQRFNVGIQAERDTSPEGTSEREYDFMVRGLEASDEASPSPKTAANSAPNLKYSAGANSTYLCDSRVSCAEFCDDVSCVSYDALGSEQPNENHRSKAWKR